jgi:hypothetical protein
MPTTRIEGDVYVAGNLASNSLSAPSGAINNAAIAAAAGISASKLEHQHAQTYSQPNTTATAERRSMFHCRGATGTVVAVHAWATTASTLNAVVTVDVLRGHTSILSSPIVLNSSDVALTPKAGTVSLSSLAAGNILSIVSTVSAGTGTLATGLGVQIITRESAE